MEVSGSEVSHTPSNTYPARRRWLLELLTKMMLVSEDKKAIGDYVSMRMLAPTCGAKNIFR
jgi:hypothetical protein